MDAYDNPELYKFLKRTANERTTIKYMCFINLFVKEHGTGTPTLEQISKFILEMRRSRQRRFAIKRYLEFLNITGLYNEFCKQNKKALGQKRRRQIKKSLPKDMIKIIIERAEEPFGLVFSLMYHTAARVGAITELRLENVEVSEDKSVKIYVKEKGERSRTLYLSKSVAKLLLEYIIKKDKYIEHYNGEMFFWNSNIHKKVRLVNEELRRITKILSMKPISSHWIRTSRVVHLYDKGMDIISIKNLLGHNDIKTTYVYLQEAGIDMKKLLVQESL